MDSADNTAFYKERKKKYINVFTYAASKAFTDEEGNPKIWKFRRLTTKDERLLAQSTNEKCQGFLDFLGETKSRTDQLLYMRNKMVMACIYPDLTDRELQKSYGTNDEYELFDELLDDPEEFATLLVKYNEEFMIKREWFSSEQK